MHDTYIDTDIEEDVRRLFTAAAEDIPAGTDLLRGLRARQATRVRRTRTRAVLSAATATVVTAGTVFALTATGAPSALAQVTSAASNTAAQSYHVTAVTTTMFANADKAARQIGARRYVTAQFDQAHSVGEETTSDGTQIRYIGGYEYVKYPGPAHGRPWLKLRVTWVPTAATKDGQGLFESLLRLSQVNPQNLLKTLESAGRVRAAGPASGPGWTGTRYEFSASTPRYILQFTAGRHPQAKAIPLRDSVTTSGTVDVDHQGRVRRIDVTVRTPLGFEVKPSGVIPQAELVSTIAMTLGDFGAPVSVAAPPSSEIAPPGKGIVYAPLPAAGFGVGLVPFPAAVFAGPLKPIQAFSAG